MITKNKKMRKLLLSMLLLLVQQLYGQTGKHVIMVTLDGLRPEFYLSADWNTPNLKQLVKEGAFAEGVVSVFPAMTFPAHTTMVTGVAPANHGIFYNGVFNPDATNSDIYWNFKQMKSPTVWGAAHQAGLKVASLVWPVSAEAPVDFNIPDIGGMGNEVLEKYSVPAGMTTILKRDVLGGKEKIDISNDMDVAKIAAWMIKNKQPNLMTIHMFGLDHKEHEFGREGVEIQKAIAKADSCVGIIRAAIRDAGLQDSTLLIVLGDHGFYDIEKSVNPNVLLARAGLLRNTADDWDAQFNTVGGGAFLFVKNNDKKIIAQVEKILKDLPADEKKYFRMVEASEMKKIGADPNAVFALSALNGASFGSTYKGDFIKPGKGGTHGHFPDTKKIQTGFMAVGNTVKPNSNLKEMRLYDVAPIIMQYLNLNLDSQLKGEVPRGLFKK